MFYCLLKDQAPNFRETKFALSIMSLYGRKEIIDSDDDGRSVTTRQTNGTYPMSRADDSDVELSTTISGAKFRDPNADEGIQSRQHKMWKKSRQNRRRGAENASATSYRDRVYREGDNSQSSDEEAHAKAASSANTDISEIESSEDEETEEEVRSANDQRKISKAQRRLEKRQARMDKKTRKLTKKTLKEVVAVKKETLVSINYSQRHINDAEAAGHSTVQSLKRQNEQLGRINEELEGLSPLMEIAKREIASIARRMARDKCFIVLCLAVVIVLIVVIVVVIKGWGDSAVEAIAGPTIQPSPSAAAADVRPQL